MVSMDTPRTLHVYKYDSYTVVACGESPPHEDPESRAHIDTLFRAAAKSEGNELGTIDWDTDQVKYAVVAGRTAGTVIAVALLTRDPSSAAV